MQTIDVRILGGGNFKLLKPVEISIYKYKIRVSDCFVTDFASIPKIAWSIIGCPIDYPLPSLIHDALYRTHLISQKEADYIFLILLLKDGVPRHLARTMYLGVRAGGEEAYDDAVNMMAHYRNYVSVMPK